jgi:hypothetical protein
VPKNPKRPCHRCLIKIFNWGDTGPSINDDTRLMRYMKLSTFLLLLDGRLFVPTIRLLQSVDRLESRVPQELLRPNYGQKMRTIVEHHEPLLLRTTRGPKVQRPNGSEHSGTTLSFLAKYWLDELALRRCVWCWNQSTDHLYALWKLYGERGVAVISTVSRIRKALEKAGAREGIVAPVRYAPLRTPQRLEETSTFLAMEQPEHLRRPYLFKDAGYRIEEEVRFVLSTNPIATSDLGGILIDVDAKALIRDFKISPELPTAEAAYMERFAHERLGVPLKPPPTDETPSFLQPFFKNEQDDFRDVFTDLDQASIS